jgi:fatty acid desaturase
MRKPSIADSFAHAQSMTPLDGPTQEVFPYNRDFDTFDREDFVPARSNNVLTFNDVERVLGDLEMVKRTKMKNNYMLPILCCVLLTVILALLGLWMALQTSIVTYLGFTMLVVFIIGAAIIAWLTWRQFKKHKMRMLDRETDYKTILDGYNKREFAKKGVNWKTGPMGAWV